jgi:hypothetical protein
MKIDCQYMRAEYSLFSAECASKTAINENGYNQRNGGTFPCIISASSVFSVAMITNRYQSRNMQVIGTIATKDQPCRIIANLNDGGAFIPPAFNNPQSTRACFRNSNMPQSQIFHLLDGPEHHSILFHLDTVARGCRSPLSRCSEIPSVATAPG